LAATRSQITQRYDDRELQTEQTTSACRLESFSLTGRTRSWFGMTFAKETPAWRATPAVRFRRIRVIEHETRMVNSP